MKISIAQRYRPYSHENGSKCLLPLTCWSVQAFPALIRLIDLEGQVSNRQIEIPIAVCGPVREFTLQQDLESGCVLIWGIALDGHYCLELRADQQTIVLTAKKAPKEGILCAKQLLHKGEIVAWPFSGSFRLAPQLERISLGCHRALDWPLVWRRLDPIEILPVLFHLSQWIPSLPSQSCTMHQLLSEQGIDPFLRAAFTSVLLPRLQDTDYQGIVANEDVLADATPISIISHAGAWIRRQFIEQRGDQIHLLNTSMFESGRMTNVQLCDIGSIDFEWRGRHLRRAILQIEKSANFRFQIPSAQSFRLRSRLSEKGARISICSEMKFDAPGKYWLDQFY